MLPNSVEETIGITYEGELYLSPNEASQTHKVHQQTIYYWVRTGQVKTLNLTKACEGTSFRPELFKSQVFIEEQSLLRKRKESFS